MIEKGSNPSVEELAKMLQAEYNRGKGTGEGEGYEKGYNKGYKDASESVSYHFPIMPTAPCVFGYDGTCCTTPHMGCINCPIKSTCGMFSAYSSSGEQTLKAEWKPSEEQMNALQRAVNKLANTNVADSVKLSIMYDNLKKLI